MARKNAAQRIPVSEVQMPHGLEQRVHRELMLSGGEAYSCVVVRRLPNGVCLEGVVRSAGSAIDAERTALNVPGVRQVLNHIVQFCEADEELMAEVG